MTRSDSGRSDRQSKRAAATASGLDELQIEQASAPDIREVAITRDSGRRERVLKERAAQLARTSANRNTEESIEVVAFDIDTETYAVEAHFVREVYPLNDIARIPCTPAFVIGLINLRGEFCAVIDLKIMFGMTKCGLTNVTHALILRDANLEFGIVADVIFGMRAVKMGDLMPPPATLTGVNRQFLRGVTAENMVVLDAAAVLAHPSIVVHEQV